MNEKDAAHKLTKERMFSVKRRVHHMNVWDTDSLFHLTLSQCQGKTNRRV